MMAVFAISPILYFPLTNSWLEQQRVAELLLIQIVCLFYFLKKNNFFSFFINILLLSIFAIGFISSVTAEYPLWALKEWGKSIGLFFVAFVVADYIKENKNGRDILLLTILAISFLLAFEFLNFYLAAIFSEAKNIDPYLLLPGFDNPRFYAQGVVLFMPLTALIAIDNFFKNKIIKNTAIITTVFQWMILIALAGRGSWAAAFIAHGAVFIFLPNYRAFIKKQILFFLFGLLLYFFLFYFIPWALSIQNSKLPSGLRSGLSAREKIWGIAWQMGLESPWLGKGPLHFSRKWNHIAAHPHQALLQWIAEWGFIATSLILIVGGLGLSKGFLIIKKEIKSKLNFDVAVWIAISSGILLAQVDGVFVMPYSETWFAIIAGMGMGCWAKTNDKSNFFNYFYALIICLVFIIILCVIIYDVPYLYSSQTGFWNYHHIGSPPRFWDQGWIPMEYP